MCKREKEKKNSIKEMVDINKAIISRLKFHGETFEIYVDPDMALEYRSSKKGEEKVPVEKILAVGGVFKDAKAGEHASTEHMKDLFGTENISDIAKIILRKGELSLTTEQRRRILKQKKDKIINIIARNAVNPKSGAPHPPQRIETAMNESKINIDFGKSAEEQIETVLKAIRPLIPIKFDSKKLAVKFKASEYGRCYPIIKKFGNVEKEEWLGEDFITLIKIPAGLKDEFYSAINNLTHGEAEIKELEN